MSGTWSHLHVDLSYGVKMELLVSTVFRKETSCPVLYSNSGTNGYLLRY